mmetsp:Transcript_32567/g.79963  ORF Transcript_32567/g.79963 Transcript_32567/m.79963 type:complete len:201 (+) Transcript_32567:401-1003(+)
MAAAATIFASGVDTDVLKFQTLSGELTVSKKGDRLEMVLPVWQLEPRMALIEQVGQCVGVKPLEFHWLGEGCRDGMAVFDSAQQIVDMMPDLQRLRDLPCPALICTAPGPAPDVACDFVYRFFAPRMGVDEDPATGSAQCSLIPYWTQKLGKTSLVSIQLSKRRAELYGELQQGEDSKEQKVMVSGTTVTVIKGEILVPV